MPPPILGNGGGNLAYLVQAPVQVQANQFPLALAPQPSTGVNATGNPFILAGSGSGTVTFQFPINCLIQVDFWNCWEQSMTSIDDDLAFNCQVYYGNRSFQLTQAPTPAELIFGNAQRPGRFGYQPWIINTAQARSSGVLMIDCSNRLTTTQTLYFGLVGWQQMYGAAG